MWELTFDKTLQMNQRKKIYTDVTNIDYFTTRQKYKGLYFPKYYSWDVEMMKKAINICLSQLRSQFNLNHRLQETLSQPLTKEQKEKKKLERELAMEAAQKATYLVMEGRQDPNG